MRKAQQTHKQTHLAPLKAIRLVRLHKERESKSSCRSEGELICLSRTASTKTFGVVSKKQGLSEMY